jgi:hypothetical protein
LGLGKLLQNPSIKDLARSPPIFFLPKDKGMILTLPGPTKVMPLKAWVIIGVKI